MIYQNYHKHSHYSNVRVTDSTASYKDYCKRAVELGHNIISSVEHGWQGRYIECFELGKEFNLKFLFGTEAYFVEDNDVELKDRSNYHLILLAKNENGRQAINWALSQANINGFYYQPRLDLNLIKELPADDIWVTTACIAGFLSSDKPEYFLDLFTKKFKNNFFLEVQAHNTDPQKELNKKILNWSKQYNVPIIAGVDSHYILNENAWERDELLASRGLNYADEEGWYMDYPSGEDLIMRFKEQGALTDTQIKQAIENTNIVLEVAEYENEIFQANIKMPTIDKGLSKEEKDNKFEQLVRAQWEKEKVNIPAQYIQQYEDEINKEIQVIKDIDHADYFLINYNIIQEGVKNGGQITRTGRGSAVSYYINKLLGFTNVDSIISDVKLYPERFLSKTRILETGSMADIDFNLGNPTVFAKAQEHIMGVGHSYPMVAYGLYKVKSAWKMFAKSQNVPFEVSNAITKQIEKYENALKHADEDEIDDIHVEDFIGEEYTDIFNQSAKYRGIIASISPHPCSYVLYNEDIERNIGLIMLKSQTGKKEYLCSLMDGKWAEGYKFLKNDLLKVSVVSLIYAIYDRIGIKPHTVTELLQLCTPEHKVWEIYKRGLTIGVNQCEQPGSKHKVMKYRPTNISELCSFVAAIRPGFQSMYAQYERREDFSYGIPTIDNLIRTPQFPQSYMLYQEHAMAVLNYAGIPIDLTYEVIKNIAKKRPEKVLKYKEQFLTGMQERIQNEEKRSEKEALEIAHSIWQIISDSVRYSFNSSHALSVAIDSLYGAYLKAEYPMEFYETYARVMTLEGKKDKVIAAQNEAQSGFGIRFTPFKFGEDNRTITAKTNSKEITNALGTVKQFSAKIAKELYELSGHYDTFMDLLIAINEGENHINKRHLDILTELDYFDMFGNQREIMKIREIFAMFRKGEAKTMQKEQIDGTFIAAFIDKYATAQNAKGEELKTYQITDCIGLLKECEAYIKAQGVEDFGYYHKLKAKTEILGYLMPTGKEEDRPILYVSEVYPINKKADGKLCGYNVDAISLGSGRQTRYTVWLTTVNKYGKITKNKLLKCLNYGGNVGNFELKEYEILENKE